MMTRSEYYETLRSMARNIREAHGITGQRVMLADMRRIYKTYGIEVKLWPYRMKSIRGAYFNDLSGPHVMIDKNLPGEQRIFTMAHELKHHVAQDPSPSNDSPLEAQELIEIGAEVFASELIFPDPDFRRYMSDMKIGPGLCTAETIVRLKHESGTTLPHKKLAKKAEFLGYASKGSLTSSKLVWKRIEENLYGVPPYLRSKR